LLDVTLHGPTVAGTPCRHSAKDRLSISCWFFYRVANSKTKQTDEQFLLVASKYQDQLVLNECEFSTWLSAFQDGICNMVTMFGDLIGWRYV
jgi:hypothetical protein